MENNVEVVKSPFNTVDIFDFIIGEIEKESGKRVKSKNIGNGYFLFDFGDNTVCHFKMEGAKDWLFGIWAIPEEDGTISIDVFGEHEWYINKFKPTQTRLSESRKLKPDEQLEDLGLKFFDSINTISQIANYPVFAYMKHYWNGYRKNPVYMYIHDWIFYRIENQIIEWKRNQFNMLLINIYKTYIKLRWGKYLSIDIYDSAQDNYKRWPRFDFNIRFKENVDEDIIYDIYHKIYKLKFYDNNVSIDFYEHNAKRPFCY